jgi:hypothetical protein
VSHMVTREQMAYYVGSAFTVTWASPTQMLRTAYNNNAPHEVITELLALPEQFYKSLDDVLAMLPHLAASA